MKIKKSLTLFCATTLLCAFTGPAYAGARRHEVNHRERNQQDRIAGGIFKHELTPAEVASLEGGEARIKYQERRDLLKNGGFLTKEQTGQLNRELNLLSKRIYQDKHN